MSNIIYIFIRSLVGLIARLPFGAVYRLSHVLYIVIYKVLRYRRKVVRRNMAGAFPDKGAKELKELEARFYRHFSDYIVESIKMLHISLDEIKRRAHFENPELIDGLMRSGRPCVIMILGHYGNWEWCTSGNSFFEDACIYQIYRPLKSKAFDRLFIRLRTRFGSRGIDKRNTLREMITLKQAGTRSIVVFLADQTPSINNIHYRTTFLNRETPFLVGAERIAKKLDVPVVYAEIRKTARGYYSVSFKLITDTPRSLPDFELTERYARMMEASIMSDPALWLWTHNRWKYVNTEEKLS
jgi:KDO2-lipid IV(A) lauroyltransferase